MESKINVTVRMKPLSEAEKAQEKNHLWNLIGDNTLMNIRTKEMFSFDTIFGDKVSTQEIFDQQVKELVDTALSGFNVTVFAYGQTSSGKTHTMRGYKESVGLIPLSILEIFKLIAQDKERDYQISLSYLEIYNEGVNDLIDPQNKNLEIRESISKGIYINRLSECIVKNTEEVLKYLLLGDESRIVAETKLNEQSSRSHTVFRINIISKIKNDIENKQIISQLNLVDLAGSEGASRTQADGLRLREGNNINRSLLALSNVINRLSQSSGGKTFINYRDSKLTRILQPALGGNSKTAIICTITQTLANYQETVNTLLFGQKAKHVKTTINVNEVCASSSSPEMDKALKEISDLKSKIKEYEEKMLSFQNQTNQFPLFTMQNNQDISNISMDQSQVNSSQMIPNNIHQTNNEFTIMFLKDQLSFLQEKIAKTTQELQEKEMLVQQIEREKRECIRKFETLEFANYEMQEKLYAVQTEKEKLEKTVNQIKEESKKQVQNQDHHQFQRMKEMEIIDGTPLTLIANQQNLKVLEMDGIKCFDLDQSDIRGEDLRMSIGGNSHMEIGNINDSIQLWQELERVKKLNEELILFKEQVEREKLNFGSNLQNNLELKEELELIKEESVIKNEQLLRYEKHCEALQSELEFYKDQNKDLLKRLDDCEKSLINDAENNSVIIMHDTQIETTKIVKDENSSLKVTVQKIKEDIKVLELEKAKSESVKAEMEYNLRAAEYNVEILKNQIENLNNEISLMRKQNEKQKKSIEILRSTNERVQYDLEHYKKLSLSKSKQPPMPQKEHQQQNNCIEALSQKIQIESSSLSIQKQQTDVDTQVCIIDVQQMNARDLEIQKLQLEIQERNMKIEELEKQLQLLNQKASSTDNELVKKYKFDNQILMSKLSDYKKAEKGAKEIVVDYEQMKCKYFTVLTENEKQKTQLQSLISSNIEQNQTLKELNEERQNYIDDLYMLRMDINKKIEENIKQKTLISQLQEQYQSSLTRVSELQTKEKELQSLQTSVELYLTLLSQVDKHLKTLVKYLKTFISQCSDPVTIEQSQRQIKAIEKLHFEVQQSLQNREYSIDATKILENLYILSSADSFKQQQDDNHKISEFRTTSGFNQLQENNSMCLGQKNKKVLQDINLNKRRKMNQEEEMYALINSNIIDKQDMKHHITSTTVCTVGDLDEFDIKKEGKILTDKSTLSNFQLNQTNNNLEQQQQLQKSKTMKPLNLENIKGGHQSSKKDQIINEAKTKITQLENKARRSARRVKDKGDEFVDESFGY